MLGLNSVPLIEHTLMMIVPFQDLPISLWPNLKAVLSGIGWPLDTRSDRISEQSLRRLHVSPIQ